MYQVDSCDSHSVPQLLHFNSQRFQVLVFSKCQSEQVKFTRKPLHALCHQCGEWDAHSQHAYMCSKCEFYVNIL